MKKILSLMTMLAFALLCVFPAYAADETVKAVPDDIDIAVYAKYVDNTEFTTIPVDESGSGSVTMPDGTKVTVSGADASMGRLVVEEVTEQDALDWAAEKLGGKMNGAKLYTVYRIDENGQVQPTSDLTVTIQTKDGSDYAVYAVSDEKTGKLQSTIQNGAVTFTTDGSSFYALCKSESKPGDDDKPGKDDDDKPGKDDNKPGDNDKPGSDDNKPGDNDKPGSDDSKPSDNNNKPSEDTKVTPGEGAGSMQTGDTTNLTLWIVLLVISGAAAAVVIILVVKKKHKEN